MLLILVLSIPIGQLFYHFLKIYVPQRMRLAITKKQDRELWMRHKKYWSDKSHKRYGPAGRLLYKKNMFNSHEGITIYRNGILAKFNVGCRIEYRFLQFKQINAIYPLIKKFKTKRRLFFMKKIPWKELQIETDDFSVYLIDSRRHDFRKLIPIIMKSMGPQWDTVYKENETIVHVIPEGDAHKHKHIRGEAPPVPAPENFLMDSSAPWERTNHENELILQKKYGSLLAQGSEKDNIELKRDFRLVFLSLFIIGSVFMAFAFLSLYSLGNFVIFVFFAVIGSPLITLSFPFRVASKISKPFQIYENGILFPVHLGVNDPFIPYGMISNITEMKHFIKGDLIIIKINDRRSFSFKKNAPELRGHWDMVRDKVEESRGLMG